MTLQETIITFALKEPFWALIIFLFVIHWLNHWVGKLFALPFRKRSDTPHKQKRTLSKTVEAGSQVSLTHTVVNPESSLNNDGYIEIKVKDEER